MARPGDTHYEIARSTGACAATGRELQAGEPYIAALVQTHGEEAFQRLDFSLESWEQGARPHPPLHLVGFWRATYQPGETTRQPLIDNDSLLDLFEQLEGAEDPPRLSFRYILALLLIRKKLLRFEGTRRDDGQTTMVLQRTGQADGQPYEVVDPGMDDAQIAAAVEQLGAVMSD
jgi:hypothetical protein